MAEENRCPQCGDKLGANAPRGVCPKCLIKVGLPSGVDIDKTAKSDEKSGFERLFVAIGQGLLSIGETFKRSENRPSLPAV